MLSHNLRIRIQEIADRIARREEVSLADMAFAQKVSRANHSAAEIMNRARRKAFQGDPEPGSLDELLQGLSLGNPDPSSHLTSQSNVEEIADFFKRDPTEDWRQRD
jgi:hypothetical protein